MPARSTTEAQPTSDHEFSEDNVIRIRGARTHNLKNIDVDIPRDAVVVITGVSGSGKSSLAHDTLFAEGQRRYLECLSTQTRQWLDQLEPPDVDDLEGLPPTVCVTQSVGSVQPRSTVGTTTEIYDFLRLLYAKAGLPHCVSCGKPVIQRNPEAIVDQILELEASRKVMLLAPLVRGRKGTHAEVVARAAQDGFVRLRVDGEIVDVTDVPPLKKGRLHDIEVIIDRIIVKEGIRGRLQESVELALRQGSGSCLVSTQAGEGWEDHFYSSRFACPDCGSSFADIEPRTFSFNSPYGACPGCRGLGYTEESTVDDGLPRRTICPECQGARVGEVARHVRFDGLALHEFVRLSIGDALEWVQKQVTRLENSTKADRESGPERQVASRLLPDILSRLCYLQKVGLHYLTLDRSIDTLSGGEFQRARLASALGSGLTGICYLLDEPSLGLHPRDADQLWQTLVQLKTQGNTVLIVEHDVEWMRQADYLIDLGPGAGAEGGRLVAAGPVAEVQGNPASITGGYLSGRLEFPKTQRRHPDPGRKLILHGANGQNLRDITVEIPLGIMVCVTGVSGSGKSTLIGETLLPLLRAALGRRNPDFPLNATLEGHVELERLVVVDQAPLGKNGRSNPATYAGMWNWIRRVFASTREAKLRGFSARRFSFNAPEGRCPECLGKGTRRLSMNFLPDLQVACSVCHGARLNPQTLEVRYRGQTLADILNMRIHEARDFFRNVPRLAEMLDTFEAVGLGYLPLGQSATTLSGGEAQRIKLAAELGKPQSSGTLFILDEPTTGLHPADIERLLKILQQLVNRGDSVLIIEHQLDVISAADWIIDLGPEGGAGGGNIVATGPPEAIAACAESHTGKALRSRLT